MQDYGKVSQLMALKGVAWNAPGKVKKVVVVPSSFDETCSVAWDKAMATLEFEATVCDEPRWVYSDAPRDNRMGITLIVYYKDAKWFLDFCLDTLATENNADWDMGIEAPEHCVTPLLVAQWAVDHVRELLTNALKVLP